MKVSKKDVAEYVEISMKFWKWDEDKGDVDELIKAGKKKHETARRVFGANEELSGKIDDKVIMHESFTVDEACKLLRDKGVEVVEDGDV